jgi:hypothetical protein
MAVGAALVTLFSPLVLAVGQVPLAALLPVQAILQQKMVVLELNLL